jgi:hypothetical protein
MTTPTSSRTRKNVHALLGVGERATVRTLPSVASRAAGQAQIRAGQDTRRPADLSFLFAVVRADSDRQAGIAPLGGEHGRGREVTAIAKGYNNARPPALDRLLAKAKDRGAHAVLDVRVERTTLGSTIGGESRQSTFFQEMG